MEWDNASLPVVLEHPAVRTLSTSSTREALILSCSISKHNNSNNSKPKLQPTSNLSTRSHSRPKPSPLSTPSKPLPQARLKLRSIAPTTHHNNLHLHQSNPTV